MWRKIESIINFESRYELLCDSMDGKQKGKDPWRVRRFIRRREREVEGTE